jgi:hypothetical protein
VVEWDASIVYILVERDDDAVDMVVEWNDAYWHDGGGDAVAVDLVVERDAGIEGEVKR